MTVLARWLVVAVALAGCRLRFDEHDRVGDAADDAPVGPGKLPDVPRQVICKAEQYAAPVPADADLVIAGTASGYAAIWVDTRAPAPAQALLLDAYHNQVATHALPLLTDTRLGGLMDVGDALMMTSATGTVQAISAFSPDLTARPVHAVGVGPLMAREPFAYEASRQTIAVVLGSSDHTLDSRYVLPSGEPRQPGSNNIVPELLEISCGLGPATISQRIGHGHCAWTEQASSNPSPHCRVADISFDMPTIPQASTNGEISDDCHDIRAVSGLPEDDALMTVWRTGDGKIRANYFNDRFIEATVADRGSAPRVTFDDTRFWIAWLDDTGTLGIRAFDRLDGTGAAYAMPDWQPRGAEAFEFVHRGPETLLAVLREGELDLLTLCP